ncbi:peptidoglycan DD-metalloendopeptidase family protein [Microbacterium betulae]|uniref:Peptidoglycan DD-metalloendopeptidase family protein n=1 Tax=Microbacterium betulae TaxID=2981139 RepID=A0AA97FJE2_9MICO|nr:peptidoglycan DD-metalloendopeptidase family protein [Microbacterium sp. AB]WOF22627.1 peptidoglycan DD-metalloendopeptidase family protein [Microbacterium sp. AB]
MQPDTAHHETGDASAEKRGSTRVAHASVAMAALVAVTVGAVALTAAAPPPESQPVAAVSIAVDPESSDDIEAPESPTAGFSDAAARFAEDAAIELPAGAYEATTADEVLKIRREAREALIRAAIAAGIDVDLSRLGGDDRLASLDGFVWPIANPVLTDPFGARGGAHMGMDIAAPGGTPIAAASPGIVVLSSESHYGYGVAVIIQHVNGVQTLYGHMTNGSRAVEVGDWVEAGDPIGLVGNTGRSFGNHLHFEVRVNGVPVDPRRYLSGAGKPADIAAWTPTPGNPAPSQPAASSEPAPAEPKPSAEPKPGTPSPTQTPTPSTPSPTQMPKPTASPSPTEPAPAPSTPPPSEPSPAPSTPAPGPSTPAPEPQPTTVPDPAPTEPSPTASAETS